MNQELDFVREFTLKPTAENFQKLLSSKKTQNVLGEIYSALEITTLLRFWDDPWWNDTMKGRDKEKLTKQNERYRIDVISKLPAAPRVGLLHKAWGMFYGTGEFEYLRIAYETAGNSRANSGTHLEAINLYTDAREYYSEHDPQSASLQSGAMSTLENVIMEAQNRLNELRGTDLRKYLVKDEDMIGKKNEKSGEKGGEGGGEKGGEKGGEGGGEKGGEEGGEKGGEEGGEKDGEGDNEEVTPEKKEED